MYVIMNGQINNLKLSFAFNAIFCFWTSFDFSNLLFFSFWEKGKRRKLNDAEPSDLFKHQLGLIQKNFKSVGQEKMVSSKAIERDNLTDDFEVDDPHFDDAICLESRLLMFAIMEKSIQMVYKNWINIV